MLKPLLRNIWLSVYHHQEQVVIDRDCTIYDLPRARLKVLGRVIPVLLAAFGVQFYVEDNSPQVSLLGDFSQSTRPLIQEIDDAVDEALAVAVDF